MRNLLLALGILAFSTVQGQAQNFGTYQANYGPYGSSYSASSFSMNSFGTRGSFTLGFNNGYPYNYQWSYPYPRVVGPVYPVIVQPVPVFPSYPPLNPIWNSPVYGYGNYPNYVGLRNPGCVGR